jgi:type II secretory pathway predicted ATPase ExeA
MLQSACKLDGQLDPRRFYNSPTHEEALARLEWLIAQRQRLGLLLGPSGSGKSLVLTKLAESLDAGAASPVVVRCSLLGLDEQQLLLEIAQQLELNPRTSLTLPELWRRVVDRLKEHAYQQLATVLLLDDAGLASGAALTAVCRLTELNLATDARLTIVLACDDRYLKRLGERLTSRCALRIDVEPWSVDDTLGFLEHAIGTLQAMDGAEPAEPALHFSPAALEKIHALSHGIPRRVSQLAEWAMVAGAGLGLAEIDDETVIAAAEEMGVGF